MIYKIALQNYLEGAYDVLVGIFKDLELFDIEMNLKEKFSFSME